MMLPFFGILRDPTLLSHDLMVGQVVILGDPSMGLFVVEVLLIILRPNLVVAELSNQKVDMITRVINGFCPLVLQIFLVRKKTAITLQIERRQELQADFIDVAPDVGIRLETGVRLLTAINNGLQSNLKKADD